MMTCWNFLVFGLTSSLILLVFFILFHRKGRLSKALRLMVFGHVPLLFYDAVILFYDNALVWMGKSYSVGVVCELIAVVSVLVGLYYLFDGWRELHG